MYITFMSLCMANVTAKTTWMICGAVVYCGAEEIPIWIVFYLC